MDLPGLLSNTGPHTEEKLELESKVSRIEIIEMKEKGKSRQKVTGPGNLRAQAIIYFFNTTENKEYLFEVEKPT